MSIHPFDFTPDNGGERYKAQARAAVLETFSSAIQPPEPISVSEWADKYRLLSQEGAAEPGRYSTARTPYMKEIMDNLSVTSPVEITVFKKCARIGASEVGNNFIGYTIDNDPCPMMLGLPTADFAKGYIRQKIDPMIRDNKRLADKMLTRQGNGGNSTIEKTFIGGGLKIGNGHSAVSLRGVDARKGHFDEVDGWEINVQDEGDPLRLAMTRLASYGARRKAFIASTPKVLQTSRIQKWYERGDQRHYYVPCPHCGHEQVLLFEHLTWEPGKPETAYYLCQSGNGCVIEEHHKTKMLAAGHWVPTAEPNDKIRSYWINALYSPVGMAPSFQDVAAEFLVAKRNIPELQAFYNTVLGECWNQAGDSPDEDDILEKREDYPLGFAPLPVLAITAGVDVQHNRIEAHVWGWARTGECWLIDLIVIDGPVTEEDTWRRLDVLQDKRYAPPPQNDMPLMAARKRALPIDMVCIDEGYQTPMVFNWLRRHQGFARAVKGDRHTRAPVGQPVQREITLAGKKRSSGLMYWPLNVSELKVELYNRLRLPKAKKGEAFPNRYLHLSTAVGDAFCQQLVAEELVTITHKTTGAITRKWHKKSAGARNEAMDCWNYARAATLMQGMDSFTDEDWDALERTTGSVGQATPAARDERDVPAAQPAPSEWVARRKARRSRKR